MAALDTDTFEVRLSTVRENMPMDIDGVLMLRGAKKKDHSQYMPTFALQAYLLRKELANCVVYMGRDRVLVVASEKSCKGLSALEKIEGLTLIPYDPKAEKEEVETVLKTKVLNEMKCDKIGVLLEDLESMSGTLADSFKKIVFSVKAKVDITSEIAQMMRKKDEKELDAHTKAGAFLSALMQKGVMRQLQDFCVMDRPVKHSEITAKVDKLLENPEKLKGISETVAADIWPAFAAVVSSGDHTLEFPPAEEATEEDKEKLKLTSIIAVIGARWKCYCATAGRTRLIDPDEKQQAAYDAAIAVRTALIEKLRPDASVSDAAKAAVAACPEEFRGNLQKTFGSGTGLILHDAGLSISATNEEKLQADTVLTIVVNLSGMKNNKKEPYSIVFVDTLIVNSKPDEERIVTNGCKIKRSDATWNLTEQEEEEAPNEEEIRKRKENREKKRSESKAGQWQARQNEILEENIEKQKKMTKAQKNAQKVQDNSYPSRLMRRQLALNAVARKGKDITVDAGNNLVYLPINGVQFPFHASTIKLTRQKTEGDTYSFGLDFKTTQMTPFQAYPELAFMKEIWFKCPIELKDNLEILRGKVREMINELKKKERNDAEPQSQDGLIKTPGGGEILKDVYVKPKLQAGAGMLKLLVNLEGHENGFRITSAKAKNVDILYSNVKHLVACPHTPRHDISAGVHIRLHNPVKLPGGQITKDIQVWTPVRDDEVVTGEKNEEDEDLEEDKEKQIIKNINRQFVRFVQSFKTKLPSGSIEIPDPEAYFEGSIAGKDLGTFSCTAATINSLLDTTEFFVATMSEIEVIVFERVVQGMCTFISLHQQFSPRLLYSSDLLRNGFRASILKG